jgi:indolepyruvate ferredoxin oxidoreductase beta subunit
MGVVTNVVFVGLGGQGVLTISDVLATAAFAAGYDVKKSEIHGMSQRGGTVTSDLRYGDRVFSPMVGFAEADYVVVLDASQVDYARQWKKTTGVFVTPALVEGVTLPNKRSMNVALLGRLAPYLAIRSQFIEDALMLRLKPEIHVESLRLFRHMSEQTRSLS